MMANVVSCFSVQKFEQKAKAAIKHSMREKTDSTRHTSSDDTETERVLLELQEVGLQNLS